MIADPKKARLHELNRRFGVVSRRSRARKLRRVYRTMKLPALVAVLAGIALGLVLAALGAFAGN